jgi:hypothetical protein
MIRVLRALLESRDLECIEIFGERSGIWPYTCMRGCGGRYYCSSLIFVDKISYIDI